MKDRILLNHQDLNAVMMKDQFAACHVGTVLLCYKSCWVQQEISLAQEVTNVYFKGKSTTELCDVSVQDLLDKIL